MLAKILHSSNIKRRTFIIVYIFLCSSSVDAQDIKYSTFVDSIKFYVHSNPELARSYIDSIPDPVAKSIAGRVSEYFMLKGMLHHKSGEQAQLFNSFILAVKYAEEEKNFDVAGQASLDLFSNTYAVKKDSSAYKFLDQAKVYFTKAKNKNGLVEVMQMPAYVAFQNNEFEKSNELLLKNLDVYKAIEDDAYYILFANFMLASNYIHLDDLTNAKKYLNEFNDLKNNPTIEAYNYKSYEVNLHICLAEIYLRNKKIDSSLYYLSKARQSRQLMDFVATKEYYLLSSLANKSAGDSIQSKKYEDSLQIYEKKMLDNTISASYDVNDSLIQIEDQLKSESRKKLINRNIVTVLILVLVGLFLIFIIGYKKFRSKIREYIDQNSQLSKTKSKNVKLKLKSRGLEEYIVELKKKIKEIANNEDITEQRSLIRRLYKDLHIESSTLIDNEENHLELINDLNDDFFSELKTLYPKLNDSEAIVCYYLAVGFKSREIGLFLNRSVRAIESMRYRISKKMGLDKSPDSLIDRLKSVLKFEEETSHSSLIERDKS